MLFYFNYLCRGRSGTRPSKSELELHLASRQGNSKWVVKLFIEMAKEAGVNTRIPHLECETIFGSIKRKLDLSMGDDSNFHCHDQVNYSVLRLDKSISCFQSHRLVWSVLSVGESISVAKNFSPSSSTKNSSEAGLPRRDVGMVLPKTSTGLSILEILVWIPHKLKLREFRPSPLKLCHGYSRRRRCNTRIAKYRRPIAAPTF